MMSVGGAGTGGWGHCSEAKGVTVLGRTHPTAEKEAS
jgi:hypothetical protein